MSDLLHQSEEVAQAWGAVREALSLATNWDTATGMRVATRPDPMREIRFLVKAVERACSDD